MREHSIKSRVVGWAFCVWAHGAATVLICLGLGWALMDRQTLGIIIESVESGVFAGSTVLNALGLMGLSALIWAMIYLSFRRVRRQPGHVRLSRPWGLVHRRGSVMVETLIVMPVLLLMTFGIAQLALINVATILTNAATFQASRSAWLWYPETQAKRLGTREGVSDPLDWVGENAHIQAAALLAPVAPGDYLEDGYLPFRAAKMRGALLGAQQVAPGYDSGRHATMLAEQLARTTGQAETLEFLASFDTRSFQERSVRKFTWAYWFSELEVRVNDSAQTITVHLTYHHMATMPIVAGIFGEWRLAGRTRKAYFTTIQRSFTRRQQDAPREKWPKGQPIRTNDFY